MVGRHHVAEGIRFHEAQPPLGPAPAEGQANAWTQAAPYRPQPSPT